MPYGKLPDDTKLDGSPQPAGGYGKLSADAKLDPTPKPAGDAFWGAANLLPESVQKFLPSFMSGPSALTQEMSAQNRADDEQKRLGRKLTLAERLKDNPATSSPVAMGFATHQIGGDVPVPKIGTAGRAEYTRAAKPSVGSIRAAGGREPYYAKTEGAVNSIVENRPNLHFTDADGNIVSGKLPESLEQFSDAIDQTKQQLFQKYDALAKKAGMFGPQVDLRPTVAELNKIQADGVITDLHPEVAEYAKKRADTLLARGGYWAEDAQRAIQMLNSSLKAFYRNPSHETASRAFVDERIANSLRASLDSTIEQSVAPGYQDLKNQYGELKTIEADVKNRAAIVARQEKGGGILGRMVDTISADEVLRGFLMMRPEVVATGGLLQLWKKMIKMQRDPNRAVKNLFRRAATPVVTPSPMSPVISQPPPDDTMRRATVALPGQP